ncbi:hypothetical protein JCM3765_002493 [Sporobolomyces pararoseus]
MGVFEEVQKKQRPVLDLLIDQISSIDEPEGNIGETLESLDSVWINQSHSTNGLSPLEALISRYPHMNPSDLELFGSLLERGADLEKVDKEILIKMMEVKNESLDSVAKRFERELVDKFDELDRVKLVDTDRRTEDAQTRSFSPDPYLRSYPSSEHPHSFSRSISSSSSSSRSRSRRDSPVHRRSPSRSRSIDSISPDTSRSDFYNDNLISSCLSAPCRPPPNYHYSPTDQIQICLALPPATSTSSLYYYFCQVLEAPIYNIVFDTDGRSSFALFTIDRRMFESGELQKRIEEAEETNPFVRHGTEWKLKPTQYKKNEDYKYARDEEEEQRCAPLSSSTRSFSENIGRRKDTSLRTAAGEGDHESRSRLRWQSEDPIEDFEKKRNHSRNRFGDGGRDSRESLSYQKEDKGMLSSRREERRSRSRRSRRFLSERRTRSRSRSVVSRRDRVNTYVTRRMKGSISRGSKTTIRTRRKKDLRGEG